MTQPQLFIFLRFMHNKRFSVSISLNNYIMVASDNLYNSGGTQRAFNGVRYPYKKGHYYRELV